MKARVSLTYFANDCRSNFKGFNTKFGPQWKDWKNTYQVKQVLSLLSKFVTLYLDGNYAKGLRVIKIVKQIKFEGKWDGLEAKYCFQRQYWPKYEANFSVSVK